ncbi:MAG: bifunctional phosphoribosyl-AMP cyclohydrolase/phosphoribosyl-ATP diphosphatase HisIE [bacterium]|nr:bifunctional phosphoribosyl-AMP cyclohydrolase/phosphoribosyl-ATP diphosphatase HisIE [bacterium]
MKVDWEKVNGLVPAIVQDSSTGTVLMLGYMDKEALANTNRDGEAWFYSRTKKRLWKKGEESGNILRVVDMKIDCDNDTLLVSAIPNGPTCHTGTVSCFGYELKKNAIKELFAVIKDRKASLPEGSYTTSLFKSGVDKISLKVSEEAMEVIHAAQKQTKERLTEETVDLLYHLFVLLVEKGLTLEEIEVEMQNRAKK